MTPFTTAIADAPHSASVEAPATTISGRSGRGRDIGAVVLFLLLALGIYGRYATKGGWFYDDWSAYALLRDQHAGFFTELSTCARSTPGGGGRVLGCFYQAAEFSLFGAHRTDYQFAEIAFLTLDATLLYTIARQCRLSRLWALLIGVSLILFPASDSTRLWDVAAVGQYVMALVLGSFALSLYALERRGAVALLLNLLSAAMALVAMATYEIAVPLVALGGALYYVRYRDRRALERWAWDIGLVVLFLIYRTAVSPATGTTFVVHRTISATVSRAGELLEGAWATWKFVYAPGTLGTIALLALACLITALFISRRDFARRVLPWLALFAFGAVVSAAGVLVYLTANDLYKPQVSGLFNRVNLPGSLGYVAMALALLGAIFEILVALRLRPVLAAIVVLATAAAWGEHQLGISADHIRSWEASWSDQKQALAGYRVALRGVPQTAQIIGFDTPIWERGWIPIFAASWDLRGAIDYETSVDPPVADPLLPGVSCGAGGVVEGGALLASYDHPGEPLYFVSPVRHLARHVSSQGACEALLQSWGRPPFWGSTVTGVAFRT